MSGPGTHTTLGFMNAPHIKYKLSSTRPYLDWYVSYCSVSSTIPSGAQYREYHPFNLVVETLTITITSKNLDSFECTNREKNITVMKITR